MTRSLFILRRALLCGCTMFLSLLIASHVAGQQQNNPKQEATREEIPRTPLTGEEAKALVIAYEDVIKPRKSLLSGSLENYNIDIVEAGRFFYVNFGPKIVDGKSEEESFSATKEGIKRIPIGTEGKWIAGRSVSVKIEKGTYAVLARVYSQ